jgi:hypothetical protein
MVKVTILDEDKDLKPEMSAKVTFLEPEKPREAKAAGAPETRVTVPSAAVVTKEGRTQVFEVREGKAVAREVKTGIESQGVVVVREGLRGGEVLVARPPEGLKDGDAVRVKG